METLIISGWLLALCALLAWPRTIVSVGFKIMKKSNRMARNIKNKWNQ